MLTKQKGNLFGSRWFHKIQKNKQWVVAALQPWAAAAALISSVAPLWSWLQPSLPNSCLFSKLGPLGFLKILFFSSQYHFNYYFQLKSCGFGFCSFHQQTQLLQSQMYISPTIKIHISVKCLKTTDIQFQSEAPNHHIQFYKGSGPKASLLTVQSLTQIKNIEIKQRTQSLVKTSLKIFAKVLAHQNLFAAPNSVLAALLWPFLDMCRAANNLSFYAHILS